MFNLQKLAQGLSRSVYRKQFSSSTAVPFAIKNVEKGNSSTAASTLESTTKLNIAGQENVRSGPGGKNLMVAAAFESLLSKDEEAPNKIDAKPDELDERILNAKTVLGLLSVTENNSDITRKHALKIVSILAEWSSINRVKLADFENDARFIKLCRLLGRAVPKNNGANQAGNKKISGFRTDDLNTVIGVAGDDEAAKLIASISLPQMIKVMSTLAQKKRRSTPLLRSLAYNISGNAAVLDLKQCADLLFAMAVLNFPDPVLISRIGIDLQTGLSANKDRPAAVGSIITSLGLLKFRDADVLESLTEWILQHSDICRPQDLSSLFLTLATLNYPTTKAEQLRSKLVDSLKEDDFSKQSDWLNHVWALVVLNFVQPQQIESVLKSEFIEKLVTERGADLTPTMKMKLLNINSAAKHLHAYSGPTLSENSSIYTVPLLHNKNKQILIGGLLDALKSLFSAENLIRTNVDTKMGFVIDVECVLDNKFNPLPVDKQHTNATRLAIMVLDFHDMCQGAHQQPNGLTALNHKLLERQNYRIINVPHNEFNTSDKLLKRVQYLEGKIKQKTI